MADLVQQFQEIKNKLDNLKTEQTRTNTIIESLEKSKAELESEILTITKTTNLEEAKAKLEALEASILVDIQKAQELLNG